MKWTHKGIEIERNDKGEFKAVINGEVVRAPSLAAMKKRIDAAKVFVPFTALDRNGKAVKVVGFRKSKSFYRDDVYLLDGDSYGCSPKSLYPNTPKNRALILAVIAMQDEETKRSYGAMEAIIAAWAKVQNIPAPNEGVK